MRPSVVAAISRSHILGKGRSASTLPKHITIPSVGGSSPRYNGPGILGQAASKSQDLPELMTSAHGQLLSARHVLPNLGSLPQAATFTESPLPLSYIDPNTSSKHLSGLTPPSAELKDTFAAAISGSDFQTGFSGTGWMSNWGPDELLPPTTTGTGTEASLTSKENMLSSPGTPPLTSAEVRSILKLIDTIKLRLKVLPRARRRIDPEFLGNTTSYLTYALGNERVLVGQRDIIIHIGALLRSHSRAIRVGKSIQPWELLRDSLREIESKYLTEPQNDIIWTPILPVTQDQTKIIPEVSISDVDTPIAYGTISPDTINIEPIPRSDLDPPIAQLAHSLDRVLFNPTPHLVQDPHSRVYNFDPYIQKIPSMSDFDFNRVVGFIPSAQDETLHHIARQANRRFTGSTSSLTSILSQIYFMMSQGKPVDISNLSMAFNEARTGFTSGARSPCTVNLVYRDGIYSVNAEKDDREGDHLLLANMGIMLENFLTMTPTEFSLLNHSTPKPENANVAPSAYQYSKTDNFVMRSQLDCIDSRLPGSGVFDIKTRAAVAIRLDMLNHRENSGYLLKTMTGYWESFEREYYDLIRSAFLKYSFQARIGSMDGVFVAYHNTERLFGFQYLPLPEMERHIFGHPDAGKNVFHVSVGLMGKLMEHIAECWPEQSKRCTFETSNNYKRLRVWVEPEHWDASQPRPVIELKLIAENLSSGRQIQGHPKFEKDDWSMKYMITRMEPSPETRKRLDAAASRQIFISFPASDGSILPTSDPALNAVGTTEVTPPLETDLTEDSANDLNDEGTSNLQEAESTISASRLRSLKRSLTRIRRMARAGRRDTERLEDIDGNSSPVIWRSPAQEENTDKQ